MRMILQLTNGTVQIEPVLSPLICKVYCKPLRKADHLDQKALYFQPTKNQVSKNIRLILNKQQLRAISQRIVTTKNL